MEDNKGGSPFPQFPVQLSQASVDKRETSIVSIRQRIKNQRVKNKNHGYRFSGICSGGKGSLVVQAEVASNPTKGLLKPFGHGTRFYEGSWGMIGEFFRFLSIR